MSTIQLYLDYAGIIDSEPDHVLVETILDYAPAYARMAEAIHAGRSLTMIVRDQTCAAWLLAAQQKYGPEHIRVVEVSHRRRLAERWGVEIPTWVTNEAIARSDLLDVPLRAQPGQSFENVLLEAFYSPFLTYDRLPLAYLADLLMSYDAERWASAEQRPLVREVLARRLQAWADAAASEGERLVVEGLQRDPVALARKLARVKVLARYPREIGRRVLGEEYDHMAALNPDLDALPIREAELTDTVDQIRVHLNMLAQSLPSGKVLPAMLAQLSGHLLVEFEAV